MQEVSIAIIGISLLFFLGHALKLFFLSSKIPDLLFLILLGYLLGPITGLLNADEFGQFGRILTLVALVVILYEAGLELRTKTLLKTGLPALGLSAVTFLTVAALSFALVYRYANQSLLTSVLVGIGVGSTSAAIVIPLVRMLDVSNQTRTIISLESSLTDVFAVVLFLVVLDSALADSFDIQNILVGIGPNSIKAVLLGMFSGFLWAALRRRFKQLTDVAFAGEAWALLSFGIIELMNLNGAIAVLALGFMLSNLDLLPEWAKSLCSRNPVGKERLALLSEVSLLLRTFFFVYLGMLIQISNLSILYIGLIISLLIFVTRFIAVQFVMRKNKFSRSDALTVMAMGPRGLASAVLATIPLQKGLESGLFIQQTIFSVILLSILFTAFFVFLGDYAVSKVPFCWLFARYRK